MPSSIRNTIPGKIKAIRRGDIVSEVILETAVGDLAAVITTRSVEDLGLQPGDEVTGQIKATNISISTCACNGDCRGN